MPTGKELFEAGKADLRAVERLAAVTAPDGDFPIVEQEIRGINYRTFRDAPPTMAAYYELGAAHGDKEFLVYEGERYSFGEVTARAKKLSHRLVKDFGITKDTKVAIAMRNFPEWFFAFMAITGAGAVAVPVNAWWTEDEFDYGLNDCGAKLVFCDGQRAGVLEGLRKKLGLTLISARADQRADGVIEFNSLLDGDEETAFPDLGGGTDDDVLILYTSGSTGNPKGAVSTHRAILSSLMSWAIGGMVANAVKAEDEAIEATARGETPADPDAEAAQMISLVAVPMFHVTGSHAIYLVSIILGRKLVLMYKWDPTRALELIQEEKVTNFLGVPTMSWELTQHPDAAKYDTSSLVELSGGGAARPPEHVKKITEAFPDAAPAQGYGLTETNAIGCTNGGYNYLLKPASTGRPNSPLIEMKCADENGNAVPTGEVGEVMIKTPSNIRCYWNNETATRAAIDEEGFLRTGDVGKMDKDGFLYIVDRIKDIVVRGGENISCIEVESALYEHDAVSEAAVFGLPDERLGESLTAVVMPKPGQTVSAEELMAHVAERLAKFKVPARIDLIDEPLPRGATGKIFKRQLKEERIDS